jgi:hypothetical protein
MTQAQVTMDVRKVSDKVSVIDVEGDLTAFAEGVLGPSGGKPLLPVLPKPQGEDEDGEAGDNYDPERHPQSY